MWLEYMWAVSGPGLGSGGSWVEGDRSNLLSPVVGTAGGLNSGASRLHLHLSLTACSGDAAGLGWVVPWALALPIFLVLPWIPQAQPGPRIVCRQMAGRWTPNAISLNVLGGDVLPGGQGGVLGPELIRPAPSLSLYAPPRPPASLVHRPAQFLRPQGSQ